MDIIRAGCTLHIVEPPKPHYWVVVTDPVGNPACVATVMLVTKKKHTDDTVVLPPGTLPFLDHDTAVNYSAIEKRLVKRILAAMARGKCELRASVDPETLKRIQEGLLRSPRTVHAHRDYCAPLMGVGA